MEWWTWQVLKMEFLNHYIQQYYQLCKPFPVMLIFLEEVKVIHGSQYRILFWICSTYFRGEK